MVIFLRFPSFFTSFNNRVHSMIDKDSMSLFFSTGFNSIPKVSSGFFKNLTNVRITPIFLSMVAKLFCSSSKKTIKDWRFWCKDWICLKKAYRFLTEFLFKQRFQIVYG